MTLRLLIFGFLLCTHVAAAEPQDRDAAMSKSQAAIGVTLGEYTFRDTQGQSFELSDLGGKPLVISMIYTSCHHVCPLITRNLAETVDVAREALGDSSFSVVTIGFDWKVDTPDRMRLYAAEQGVDVPGWYFLAGDSVSVAELSENLGFQFAPSTKGFDHLAQTTVVAANGQIYRQVYGVDIGTQSLVEPLKELVFDTPREAGLIDHWLDNFKLFCTVYDPNSDRYRFDYSIFMTIITGLLCFSAIAVFIAKEWKTAR